MPEISEEQYEKLMRRSAGYGQLKTQYDQLRRQYGELEASHSEVTGALEAAGGELEQLRGAAPVDADSRVAELTGKLRDVTHRGKFAELAKAAGIDDKAIADAYTLSGYKPEKDDVDADALGLVVKDLVESRPYLVKPAAEAPPAAPPARPGYPAKVPPTGQAPAENAGRGGNGNAAPTLAQAVNAKFAASGRTIPGKF